MKTEKTPNKRITPGPWKVRGYTNADGNLWIDCDAWKRNKAVGGTLAIALNHGCGPGNMEANAQAIAAVPDLVAALRDAVNQWHSDNRNFERELKHGTPKWLQAAREALRKAGAA